MMANRVRYRILNGNNGDHYECGYDRSHPTHRFNASVSMNASSISRSKSALGLIGWLALCFAVATMGAIFLPGAWYAALKKPSWNPPGWVFGPVWTALYTMMAVAAWLVWRQGGWERQCRPLFLFLTQLLLNALWSPLRILFSSAWWNDRRWGI